ncbi:MAG: von Willebrand factor type A domain-containing protein [Candidatus Krumholzibacteria bacterium]
MSFAKRVATVLLILGLIACASASSELRSEAVGGYGQITGRIFALRADTSLAFANIIIVGANKGAMSLRDGRFTIRDVFPGTYTVKVMMMGYKTLEIRNVVVRANETVEMRCRLTETIVSETQIIEVTGERKVIDVSANGVRSSVTRSEVKAGDRLSVRGGRSGEITTRISGRGRRPATPIQRSESAIQRQRHLVPNNEAYARVDANKFLSVIEKPMSTFSIDVDAASYSNLRRFIRGNTLPPAHAVRVEELINYFRYDYPEPDESQPFSITTEMSDCPWNVTNKLVHIGLQGKRLMLEDLPPSNLVFLLDVSGSMKPANKLPLVKSAIRLLTRELRRNDRVALVAYNSTVSLCLPSTRGDQKRTILDAVDRLQARGSTAGAAGLRLAYAVARKNFLKKGNNRVILATDGDFNVGVSSDHELVQLIEKERESGVFLSIMGFGTGNLKDSKLEKIADKGNGHYAYIDNILEAKKVLIREIGATLFTIAKDVKIQIEFNPAKVKSYRLIGYENRVLEKEDFNNDKKDAGELGAGHSVTALYEVVPVGPDGDLSYLDEFKYFHVGIDPDAFASREILTVSFRYKPPAGDTSRLITKTVMESDTRFDKASDDFRFSAAVAEFGMLLGDSAYKGKACFEDVLAVAKEAKGKDEQGYRAEFIQLVEICSLLTKNQ